MNISNLFSEENASIDSQQINLTPQKKELRPRNHLAPGALQEYKRTYVKVPLDSKDQLSQLVFKEGFKIKEAAHKLAIKYATAKTIIFHIREEKKRARLQNEKCCGFKSLTASQHSKLKIISKISGKLKDSKEYTIFDSQTTIV